jgi:hypothetical protein
MNTLVKCPGCGKAVSVSGKWTKCRECGTQFSLQVRGGRKSKRTTHRRKGFKIPAGLRQAFLYFAAVCGVLAFVIVIFLISVS